MSTSDLDSEQDPFLPGEETQRSEKSCNDRHNHGRSLLFSQIMIASITSLLWICVIIIIIYHIPALSTTKEPTKSHHQHKGHAQDDSAYSHDEKLYPHGIKGHNITSGTKFLSCGETAQEAMTLHCKYDVLLNGWVPSPCYSRPDILKEYTDDHSWNGYRDAKLTHVLTTQEMSESATYYTSTRDHINHCAMIWLKQFWVFWNEQDAMDTMIANPRHTDHCIQYLLNAKYDNSDEDGTLNVVQFLGCYVKE